MQTIYLAGGCFWCTEAVFQSLEGVVSVMPGYMGGTKANPTYEEVCSGTTGHAEAIKIEYNPDVISLEDLLDIFFASHDPTTLNKQGADVGTQYRSAIFYTTEDQRLKAVHAIEKVDISLFEGRKVVTELVPASTFYPAETSHREYYLKNRENPYCQIVISPKLEKLQKQFAEKLKKDNG